MRPIFGISFAVELPLRALVCRHSQRAAGAALQTSAPESARAHWRVAAALYEWISANCNKDEDFKAMIRSPWHLKRDEVDVGCRRVLVWHSNGAQEIITVGDDIPISSTKNFLLEKLTNDYGVEDISDIKLV